jgi:exopolysaccharide biosynthesis polyprenyl glycosylphosphotransferase
MTPSNRKTLSELTQFGDIGLLFGCLGISYISVFHHHVSYLLNSLDTRRPVQVFVATAILALAWHKILQSSGFYRSRRLDGNLREALDVCSGSSLCSLAGFFWLWLICPQSNGNLATLVLLSILFGTLTFVAFVFTRSINRAAMRALRARGRNLRHILIVGTNRRADGFARDVALHPEWGYKVHGFVDDRWWFQETADSNSGSLLGDFDALPHLLRTLPIDEVMVALPVASFYQQTCDIIGLCRNHGIAVRTIGTFFEHQLPKRSSFLRGAVGTITLHDESWNPRASMIKRLTDTVISLMLLFVLTPLLIALSLLIKCLSPGPIFFKQTRLGQGKRPFQIWKFRTMVPDAEKIISQVQHLNETQGPTFKATDDPRITPFGKFLRQTSLDELPQLFNVLVGDMSLVGPRPLPLRDYEGFSQDWHRRRFSVKPGITCLWQIMGRSSIGFDEWMELDMRYIDHWSVWLDVKILFQTIPAVFRGSGAA